MFFVGMRVMFVVLTMLWVCCEAKQKQCDKQQSLIEMKQNLIRAEKELSFVQERIHQLEEEIALQEIRNIEVEIDKVDTKSLLKTIKNQDLLPELFEAQRNSLSEIIQKYPACADRAQIVLNKILILITKISDELSD